MCTPIEILKKKLDRLTDYNDRQSVISQLKAQQDQCLKCRWSSGLTGCTVGGRLYVREFKPRS